MTRSTLFALALLLTGCAVPTCTHPLSDAETTIEDDRLVGSWHLYLLSDGKPSDPKSLCSIVKLPGKPVTYALIPHDKKQESRLRCTQIGKDRYISAYKFSEPPEKVTEYAVARYVFTGTDKVEFHLPVDDKAIAAIQEKRIPGTVLYSKPDNPNNVPETAKQIPIPTSVTLTAETAVLRKFFENEGRTLCSGFELDMGLIKRTD